LWSLNASINGSDESLKKWKASLGITDEVIASDPNDPRKARTRVLLGLDKD